MPRRLDPHLPQCPSHEKGRVTRAGTYTAHGRVLYRCLPPRGAKAHTFTLEPKGFRRGFRYPTAEIARALWMIGRGTSYWEAGADARERTGRPESKDTYLAVYWLERFGERIFEQLRPRPRKLHSVIVDSVPFNVATVDYKGMPVEGGRMRFVVFGAASQERVHGPYRVLLLRAYPRKDAYAWRSFLREIEGEADRIVCDGEQALNDGKRDLGPRPARLQRGSYKRLERLDLMLNLHTLALNRLDKEPVYARIISGAR